MAAYIQQRTAVMTWHAKRTAVIAFSLPSGCFSKYGPKYLNTGISKKHITAVLTPNTKFGVFSKSSTR